MTMHVPLTLETTAPRWPRMAMMAGAIALVLSTRVSASADERLRDIATRMARSQLFVTNCDDSGPGSLRDTIAGAASGDMVDLSQLTCSTITLTSGAIEIPQDDLYLKYSGEGGTPPTIDGNFHDRAFHHTGTGTLKIVGLTITDGKYDNTYSAAPLYATGGCIDSSGSVYLGNSTVSHCTTRDTRGDDAGGGGIYAKQAMTLQHSVVSDNTATSTSRTARGGGASTFGAVDIEYTAISGNSVSEYEYYSSGGGVAVLNLGQSPSTIANSTISGNEADRGGGLRFGAGGTYDAAITITNSTISGNTARSYAAGAYFRGPVSLIACTIAFNSSAEGAGVVLGTHGPVQIESSILADNTNPGAEYDLGDRGYAITVAGSHDLIVTASSIVLPPDTVNADPMLLPLADNGGPTHTHALGDGSPAIDRGDNVDALSFDQRGNGYPRVSGGAADIGAFERPASDTIFADGFDTGAYGAGGALP